MTVTRGSFHVFLGMKVVEYTNKGKHIAQILLYAGGLPAGGGHATSRVWSQYAEDRGHPGKQGMFRSQRSSLYAAHQTQGEIFQSVVVAKPRYYVSIRARSLNTSSDRFATSFLTTGRISKSTKQDMTSKLKGLLKYVKSTLHTMLKYIMGANDLPGRMRTCVDAAYVVHRDKRSHPVGIMLSGHGGVACKSSKQKLNTKSSMVEA